MARFGFFRWSYLTGCLAMCILAASSLALGACAPSPGETSAKTMRACSAALSSTSTLSVTDRISGLVEQTTCNQLHDLKATYQQTGEVTHIVGTVSETVPRTSGQVGAVQENVKALCFKIQRALWTSDIPVQDVTVTILGPMFDDYYDRIISWYGTAHLGAETASRFDWAGVSVDEAWMMFDRTLLQTEYAPSQLYLVTPAPTSSTSHP